jgi:TRAP-type mannitol/chloroaromatic compound transport system permease large subunit
MRTTWKVLTVIVLGGVLVGFEAIAVAEVVRGRGAEIFIVNYRGVAITWMYAAIDGAVACVAVVGFILAGAIYRWRRIHGY